MSRFLRRYLQRNSLRKGVLGGSRIWTAVFVVMTLIRFVSKSRGEKIVFREELPDGATLVIANGRDTATITGG